MLVVLAVTCGLVTELGINPRADFYSRRQPGDSEEHPPISRDQSLPLS